MYAEAAKDWPCPSWENLGWSAALVVHSSGRGELVLVSGSCGEGELSLVSSSDGI